MPQSLLHFIDREGAGRIRFRVAKGAPQVGGDEAMGGEITKGLLQVREAAGASLSPPFLPHFTCPPIDWPTLPPPLPAGPQAVLRICENQVAGEPDSDLKRSVLGATQARGG